MIDRSGTLAARSAPSSKATVRDDGDTIESSGQAIVALLKEAADTAKTVCEQAMSTAQKVSNQVRAAEDQVKLLESELQQYVDRATRAEKWLARIHHEIEGSFFGPNSVGRSG